MKRTLSIAIATALMATLPTTLAAKSSQKSGFEATKKEEVRKLEEKLSRIQKRLSCVKKAKKSADLKECASKYPLVKRSKSSKKSKKAKKSSK